MAAKKTIGVEVDLGTFERLQKARVRGSSIVSLSQAAREALAAGLPAIEANAPAPAARDSEASQQAA